MEEPARTVSLPGLASFVFLTLQIRHQPRAKILDQEVEAAEATPPPTRTYVV